MAGAVLAIGVAGACAITALTVLPLLGVHVERQRAANAADAAALAAADALRGLVGGVPCELADELARRNDAVLVACDADAATVRVRVEIALPLGTVSATSRAGPPAGAQSNTVSMKR
ncbi:helicase [Agromyces mediolanus]|uniref:Rv3654c family TadE-like protein n=1 Tax=Agromyces mediolanus TaxID=41986 RepID=UPI0038345EF8